MQGGVGKRGSLLGVSELAPHTHGGCFAMETDRELRAPPGGGLSPKGNALPPTPTTIPSYTAVQRTALQGLITSQASQF